MRGYPKSIETKKRIIDASKILFYEKGYNDTTCRDISNRADVNIGLIHYHFKSKKQIAAVIYRHTIMEIKNIVRINMLKRYGDCELAYINALETWVLLSAFMIDDNYKKFIFEICEANLLLSDNNNMINSMTRFYVMNKNLNSLTDDLKLFRLLDASITTGFIIKYVTGQIHFPLDGIIENKIRSSYRLILSNEDEIEDIIFTSHRMFKELNIELGGYFDFGISDLAMLH